jgi:small-conductance mechanosensitive channel/CRP-like cAMP-binding protein
LSKNKCLPTFLNKFKMDILIIAIIVLGYLALCGLLIWGFWFLIQKTKLPKRSKPVVNNFGLLLAMGTMFIISSYYFAIWEDVVGVVDDKGYVVGHNSFEPNHSKQKIKDKKPTPTTDKSIKNNTQNPPKKDLPSNEPRVSKGHKFDDIKSQINKIFSIFPILLLAYFINSLLTLFVWYGAFVDENGEDSLVPKLLRQLTTILLYIIALIVIVAIFFPNALSNFITGLGATGAVGAFLGKEPVKQAFTALGLNINKPIKRGDIVEMNGFIGEVKEIGWKNIKLLTPDGNLLTIPNVMLVNSCYINHSRPNAGATARLEIRLDSIIPPTKAEKLLERCAEDSNMITGRAKVKVLRYEGNDAYYLIEVPTDSTDLNTVKSQILSSIWYMSRRENLVQSPDSYYIKDTFEKTQILLNDLPLLKCLTPEEDAIIAEKAEWLRYGPLERIMIEGEHDYSLCIIAEGNVEILKRQQDGSNKVITQLTKNEILGENGLLGQPRGATVRSVGETIICKISAECLKPILMNRPEIMEDLSDALAERELQNEKFSEKYRSDMERRNAKKSVKQNFFYSIKKFFSEEDKNNANKDAGKIV